MRFGVPFWIAAILLVATNFFLAMPPMAAATDEACDAATTTTKLPTVSELLSKPNEAIVDALGGIYEHSAWVAEAFVADYNPEQRATIGTVSGLAAVLKGIVDGATDDQKLALLRAHPDLCAKAEALRELTKESQEEQSGAGLQSLTPDELEQFKTDNEAYRTKFGFPFILAVRNARKSTVLAALDGRLNQSSSQQEFHTAVDQVHNIAWMRLLSKVNTENAAGFLTCHVLDTANGIPAEKMRIVLTRLSPPESAGVVGEYVTNDDGRLEGGPALKGGSGAGGFLVGTYQWDFYVGDYFASKGQKLSGTPFLDVVPIRFGIDNPDDHYHVPLLVSPWSFSTYRGS